MKTRRRNTKCTSRLWILISNYINSNVLQIWSHLLLIPQWVKIYLKSALEVEIFVGFIPKLTHLPKDSDWGSEDLFQRTLVNRTLGKRPFSSSKPAGTFCISSSGFQIDTPNVAILRRTLWCQVVLLSQWIWPIHNIGCKTLASSFWTFGQIFVYLFSIIKHYNKQLTQKRCDTSAT